MKSPVDRQFDQIFMPPAAILSCAQGPLTHLLFISVAANQNLTNMTGLFFVGAQTGG